jgi:bacillithiol system protein YtxJ
MEEILLGSQENSGHLAVAVFKHSTRCYISRSALKSMQQDWQMPAVSVPVYLLDLLQYPDLSRALTEQFNVIHQSPQLLLISRGACVYDRSHENISASEAGAFIEALSSGK